MKARDNVKVSVHASLATKKHRLTPNDWHHVPGHTDLTSAKHLEKHGLVEIAEASVSSDMRCVGYRERNHKLLHTGGAVEASGHLKR